MLLVDETVVKRPYVSYVYVVLNAPVPVLVTPVTRPYLSTAVAMLPMAFVSVVTEEPSVLYKYDVLLVPALGSTMLVLLP